MRAQRRRLELILASPKPGTQQSLSTYPEKRILQREAQQQPLPQRQLTIYLLEAGVSRTKSCISGLRALPEACEVPGGSAQQGMAALEV